MNMVKSKVVLSGDLSFLNLGELLQLVGSEGATGALKLTSQYVPEPGVVYFRNGNVIDAKTPQKDGIDAAYELFGWTEGDFEFIQEDVQIQKKITTNRMEIILDGLRMVDEGEIEKLGPISYQKSRKEPERNIPVIKGPLIDYFYVADEEMFSKGRTITREQRHGAWIWAILEGVVEICKETDQGQITILRLGPGSFLGSLNSFFNTENVRSATAIAFEDVHLGVLNMQLLSKELSSKSRKFRQALVSLDKRLRQVTNCAIDAYLNRSVDVDPAKNRTVLIKQGDKDKRLLMLKNGGISIVRNINGTHMTLVNFEKGDIFGSIPFLDIGHEPYSASALASEDIALEELDPEAFQKEYEDLPSTVRNLIENVATCVSMTTRMAVDFKKKKMKKN